MRVAVQLDVDALADVDLEQVAARRTELPLVGDMRLELLQRELTRLAAASTR